LEQVNSIYILLIILILICLVAILMLLVKVLRLRKTSNHLAAKNEELQVRSKRDEPESFRYKLSPHLLKNALNAIQSHAYQSYYALDKLSHILDYILYDSEAEFVPLHEELSFALDLIEINRLKTSPLFDLHIRNKIDKDDVMNNQALIPPFITINPIENAFKHADLQSDSSFISVVFEIKEGWFLLSVSNKTTPKKGETILKGGLGNKAFRTRLTALYGDDYQLKESEEGNIYNTRLKLKLYANT
jgi:LytS/YehU family sensor histidine kinase